MSRNSPEKTVSRYQILENNLRLSNALLQADIKYFGTSLRPEKKARLTQPTEGPSPRLVTVNRQSTGGRLRYSLRLHLRSEIQTLSQSRCTTLNASVPKRMFPTPPRQ